MNVEMNLRGMYLELSFERLSQEEIDGLQKLSDDIKDNPILAGELLSKSEVLNIVEKRRQEYMGEFAENSQTP